MYMQVCADTIVGNQMIRGISGGQRKRVTTGEMTVGPMKTLFMVRSASQPAAGFTSRHASMNLDRATLDCHGRLPSADFFGPEQWPVSDLIRHAWDAGRYLSMIRMFAG
jgi:hypothetical protein